VSALPAAPAASRSPWQRLYGAVLSRRARRLARRAERLPLPVVSVGNLAWGGSGKTPFVAALAEHLTDGGRRVAVLSRGYGRASRGALVVCRGAGPEVEPRDAGDEPFELARALPDIAVVVGERRVEAGRLALADLDPKPDLFLLDDGFSHAALARDLDLLLFAAADPWGKGRLLPTGLLREPLAAAARADAAVLTSADDGDRELARELAGGPTLARELAGGLMLARELAGGLMLARELARFGFRGEGFASATVALPARLTSGEPVAPGTAVYAVAAIARPDGFFESARRAGLKVVGRASRRDHADYPDDFVRGLEARARSAGAQVVVTTAKDRAKLEGRLALPLAVLPIEARPEPAFWSWFDQRVAGFAR
jgi:tetraacyldisaccharide 4'-kinase